MLEFTTYTPYIYDGSKWVVYTPYVAKTTSNLTKHTTFILDAIPIIDSYTFPTDITSLDFERR